MTYDCRIFHWANVLLWRLQLSYGSPKYFIKTIAAHLVFKHKEIRAQDGDCTSLPGGHHIGEPHAAQVLGHLTVDLLHVVAAVGNQHLLHNWQLFQPAATHLDKFHKAAAGYLTLAQPDGRQTLAALGNADQLLIQGLQAIGADHQLHQAGAVEPDAAQHLFADCPAKVEVGDRGLVTEERLKLLLVEEEVHDYVDLGRVPDQGIPAAPSDGVKVRLPRVFTDHIDAQVLQVHVFFRGQSEEQLIAEEVVVQCQLSEAVALVCDTQDPWGWTEGVYSMNIHQVLITKTFNDQ